MRPTLRALVAATSCALSGALLAVPASASAQPLDLFPNTGWYSFLFDGPGPIVDPADGFALTLAGPATLRVVDAGVVGDVFSLVLTGPGSPVLTTSPVAPADDGADTGILDGDAAWADPRFSRGELLLGPGDYTIAIALDRAAPGTVGGLGLISVTSTPEPATLGLVAGGLAVAGLASVRRRGRAGG